MEKHPNEILSRYYRGESSLKEEQILKEEYRKGALPDDPVFAFSNLKSEMPAVVAEKLGNSIQKRQKHHIRQRIVLAGSIAALLILILSLRMLLPESPVARIQLSDNLKKERFENALRVIGNALEEKPTYNNEKILYEDNKIIIAVE